MRTLEIEVWADVVCPWCYIGERRLERALEERPDLLVQRRWRPFQLQPGMPPGGMPWDEFARTRFGGKERAQAMFAEVAAAGAADGVVMRFDRVATAPNTVDAHRLVLFGHERGREWETVDALFAAYFEQGRDLNDLDQLAAVAEAAGLDPAEARAFLAGDEGRDEVAAAQHEAGEIGVQGVPFFVIDGRWAVSGAQPAEAWRQVLDQVGREA